MSGKSWIAYLIGCLVVPVLLGKTGHAQEGVGRRPWADGQEFRVAVKQYYRDWLLDFSDPDLETKKNIPRIQHEYEMTIRVDGYRSVSRRHCAQITFIPGKGSPPGIAESEYTLSVETQTLVPVALEMTRGAGSGYHAIAKFGDHTVLLSKVYGFPVDWLVNREDVERPSASTELVAPRKAGQARVKLLRSVSATLDDGSIRVSASLIGGEQRESLEEVRQMWDPKQMWWKSFSRTIDGHLDLQAVLIEE